MQTTELDRERLRHLAGLRPADGGKVLSLFLNLDPSQLPTAKDRSSAVGSLLDEAGRQVEAAAKSLPHAAKVALHRDAERARAYLSSGTSWAQGAHGLALFSAGGGEELFEVVKLAHPVEQRVVVDDTPWIEPLAHQLPGPALLVVLVDRRRARFLHGPADALVELERVEDDVHGWHDQGGWSQARYQRGIEKEVHDHLRHTAELTRALARRGFDGLAVGATGELMPAFEAALATELRERLLGRFDIDVEASNAEAVGRAVAPLVEGELARRSRDAVERLEARLGGDGPAAAGLADVLAALTERRVETLIYADGFSAPGAVCPRCGWIGMPAERCPVDGTETEARDNILDDAVETALEQSAEMLPVPEPELRGHGPIAAILRF